MIELIAYVTPFVTILSGILVVYNFSRRLTAIMKIMTSSARKIEKSLEDEHKYDFIKIIKNKIFIKEKLQYLCKQIDADIVSFWVFHNGISTVNSNIPFLKMSMILSHSENTIVKRPFNTDENVLITSYDMFPIVSEFVNSGDVFFSRNDETKTKLSVNVVEKGIKASYFKLNSDPMFVISIDYISREVTKEELDLNKINKVVEEITNIIRYEYDISGEHKKS